MTKRRHWDVVPKQLRQFMDSLSSEERELMSLSWDALAASSVVVAIREKGKIIAAAGVRRVKALPVAWFVVHRHYQGRGYGRQLNERLNQKCRRAGYRFLTLSVDPENIRAVKLYSSSGYRTFFKRRDKTYMIKFL